VVGAALTAGSSPLLNIFLSALSTVVSTVD
jgi:hypothetical protein